MTDFLYNVWDWFLALVKSASSFQFILGIGIGTILIVSIVKALL